MKESKSEFVTYPTESAGYAAGGVAIEPVSNANLPPDATPIKCNKRDLKLKAIRFAGEQMSRVHQILTEHHLNPRDCLLHAKTRVSIDECDLILPAEVVSRLPQAEIDRARDFEPPIQMISHPPVLFRFVKKKYVDELFDSGRLLLSSFCRCKKKEAVDCRVDASEGVCSVTGMTEGNTIEALIGTSGNPLMLCFSLSIGADHKPDDECIEVCDFDMFLHNVTDAIIASGIKVRRIMFGPCTYSDRHIVRRFVGGNATIDDCTASVDLKAKQFDYDKLLGAVFQIANDNHYFRKPLRFAGEHEFRIVWDCNIEDDFDHCVVTVKGVDRCCSRRLPLGDNF